MKGLLNLLTVLAALLNLTTGCGLRRHGNTAGGLIQLGNVIAGGPLGGGGAGGTVGASLSSVLAGSTRGRLLSTLGGIGVSRLSSSASSVTSGLGTGAAGSGGGLGPLAAGLGGSTGGSLLAQVGNLAMHGLRRGGSNGDIGPISGVPISGASPGLIVGQGLQQAGRAFAGGLIVAASSTGRSSTLIGGNIQQTSAGNNLNVAGNQRGGLPEGSVLPGGSFPVSRVPGSGGGPVSLGAGGAVPAAGLLGNSLGVPSAGVFPGGVTSQSSASSSTISASAINTVQTLRQTSQHNGNQVGAGSPGAGSVPINSAIGSATQLAGQTAANIVGVTSNLNGGFPGTGAPNGGTGLGSPGAAPGGNTLQGLGQPSQPIGQLPRQVPLGAGGTPINSAAELTGTSARNFLGVSTSLTDGGIGGGAPRGGSTPSSSGAIPGPGSIPGNANAVNLVDGVVETVASGLGGRVSSSGSAPGSINSATGAMGALGLGQPSQQPSEAPHTASVGAGSHLINSVARSAAQFAGSSTQIFQGDSATVNVGSASGTTPTGGVLPGASGVVPGSNQGRGLANFGQPVNQQSGGGSFLASSTSEQSTTSMRTHHSGSAIGIGSAFPAGSNQGRGPANFGQPVNQQSGGGSFLASSTSEQSTTSLRTHHSGSAIGIGSNQGRGPANFGQPVNQQSGGGSFLASSTSEQSTTSMRTHHSGSAIGIGLSTGQAPGMSSRPMNHGSGVGSFMATTSSSHTEARWGASLLGNSHGPVGDGGLPSLGNGGPAGGAPSRASGAGLTAGGAGGNLLGAIVQAGTGRGSAIGPGALPQGVGGLGSSRGSISGSTAIISGTTQHAPLQRRNGMGAAATAGIVLGTVAGALAIGAIGSGIASTLQSGMAGGARRVGGCGGGGCRSGCGRKRRSLSQSKVPVEVLDNIPMNFNRL